MSDNEKAIRERTVNVYLIGEESPKTFTNVCQIQYVDNGVLIRCEPESGRLHHACEQMLFFPYRRFDYLEDMELIPHEEFVSYAEKISRVNTKAN